MTAKIDSITYHTFYEEFKIAFLKAAFPPDGVPTFGRRADSPEIWKETDEEGNYIIYSIIGSKPSDPTYFSRMRSVIKTVHGKATEHGINAKAIFNALVYLGYELPADITNKRGFPLKEKAQILIEIYKEHKFGKGWSADTDPSLKIACNNVEHFYKDLAGGDTKSAWELLSPTFKNREIWNGDYNRFHDGYATTLALRHIHAFNPVKTSPQVIECKVFYEDEVLTYPITGLSAARIMTVAELEEFSVVVKKIKMEIEGKGGTGFEKVPLSKLFDPTGMEFIWYECGFKGSELHRSFSKPHSETVYRLYDVYCTLVGDKWLINNITPVKTYSVR